jgi:hypothetical protein
MLKGYKLSKSHKEKIRQKALGKKHTKETKEKMRKIAIKNGNGNFNRKYWIKYFQNL